MIEWLMQPRIFNLVIMVLYSCAICWWSWHGRWVDALYWVFALGITATVTFGYQR